jgi:hypothetical protein
MPALRIEGRDRNLRPAREVAIRPAAEVPSRGDRGWDEALRKPKRDKAEECAPASARSPLRDSQTTPRLLRMEILDGPRYSSLGGRCRRAACRIGGRRTDSPTRCGTPSTHGPASAAASNGGASHLETSSDQAGGFRAGRDRGGCQRFLSTGPHVSASARGIGTQASPQTCEFAAHGSPRLPPLCSRVVWPRGVCRWPRSLSVRSASSRAGPQTSLGAHAAE